VTWVAGRISLGAAALAAAVLATTAGCDRDAGTARELALATESARRLVGVWSLRLTRDGGAGDSLEGTVAIVESHAVLEAPPLPRALHVGTYDADLDRWGLGASSAGHGIVGRTWDDSVALVLGPEGRDRAIRLRGVWEGDSVVGRWQAAPRSGAGAVGRFSLVRRARSGP
jgi:hypothetical protein